VDFENYFDRVYADYGKYAAIPVALWVLSVLVLGFAYFSTAAFPYVTYDSGSVSVASGDVFDKGIEFSSGTEVQARLNQQPNILEVESAFANAGFPEADATLGDPGSDNPLILVKLKQEIEGKPRAGEILNSAGYDVVGGSSEIQLTTYSSSVSQSFFTQAVIAVLLAFTTMSLVIFAAFKDITPSIAVVFAAAGDITFSLAAMHLLGIPLTLGTIAALLMLIGYSVDTDIVLSSRVLKKNRGKLKERIWSSVKTGVTMSAGGIAAFTILFTVSRILIGAPSIMTEIASVMIIGLLADIPLTWFGNAYILKKYVEDDWKPVESVFDKIPTGGLPWT